MTHTNGLTTPGWNGRNVIAVSFLDDSNAYNALTLLKALDDQGRVNLQEATVVVRGEDGQLVDKERVGPTAMPGAAGGGLLGLLVGVIGGPLGVLIGGTYGLFVGSLFDVYEIGESDSALAAMAASARLGHTALLAVVDEQSPEVVDVAMADLGGTVVRRPQAEIEAEVAAAEKAERHAKMEARKELVRARREHDKAAVDAKLEELKSKLSRGRKGGGAAEEKPAAAAH